MTKNSIKIREKILKGLELSYERLIKSKIDRNLDLVVSDNGKIIHLDPKTLKK
jgi:hypothetical protein